MTRNARIQLISLIVLVGFFVAVAYRYWLGYYLMLPFPYNTFLYNPSDGFKDFINLYDLAIYPDNTFNNLYKYRNGPFQFGFLVVGAFGLFSLPTPVAANLYVSAFALSMLLIVYSQVETTGKLDSWKNAFILSFLTYPFLIAIDRANLEAVVFVLAFLFLWAFQKQRPFIAIACLAVAIAIKPFPAVLLVLLLKPLRLKSLTATLVLAAGIMESSVLIRLGGKSMASLTFADDYQKSYAFQDGGLGFGHSLWGLLKICLRVADDVGGTVRSSLQLEQVFTSLARPYFFATALLFAAIACHIVFREKVLWKKVALLVCSMNLLPFVSGDYKLLHLYLPIFLFMNAEDSDRLDPLYTTLFGLLLIPKSYYYFPQFRWVSLDVALNPCLMLLVVLVIIISSWSDRRCISAL